MTGQVATSNMAEVLFLLERHHAIVDVGMRPTWPYGIEDVCVTLEGEDIELDHRSYLGHGGASLAKLSKAFEAVLAAVAREEEQRFFGRGGATGGGV